MKTFPIPENEPERIAALVEFQILDTAPEKEFDDIVELASRLCEVPVSLITFVDEKRQWFKASHGLEISETPREAAFCAHTINEQALMLVPDAAQDERFFDNPLVIGKPNIRFYAGMPLTTDEGLALGSLCVIDRKPRTLTATQILALEVLGKNVITLLNLRSAKQELLSIITALPVITLRVNAENRFTYCQANDPNDLLMPKKDFIGKRLQDVLPAELTRLLTEKLTLARQSGEVEVFEYSLLLPAGEAWFQARVFRTHGDDVTAIVSNITREKKMEEEKIKNFLFLRAVTENVPALISYWSPELRCTFLTKRHEKWFEKKAEGLIGKEMHEVMGAKVAQEFLPFASKALTGEPQDFQSDVKRTTGGNIFLRVQFIPEWVEGRVIGFFSLVTNITKIKLIEEANRKIEEMQQRSLRAAMNPHFIYNALNSIQYYITHNDKSSAITYLSKFSKLVRGIMHSSLTQTYKLSQELELLQTYIEIEQIRFTEPFDFVLILKDGLDPDKFEVPPLLIQPFVENAIKHGLYNKKGRGRLRLTISNSGNTLVVCIEDDGIGRGAALKLKSKNFPEHESKGIDITNARIQLMSNGVTATSQVEDLTENNKVVGTRVILNFIRKELTTAPPDSGTFYTKHIS